MAGRFDLRPLIRGVVDGLRKRRDSGTEPADVRTRIVLVAVPVAVGAAVGITGTDMAAADQFLAAVALFLGALLTVFGQIAAWRDRLAARRRRTDGVDLRALNETVAHILLAVIVTLATACALVVRANLGTDLDQVGTPGEITARCCSVVASMGFAYLVSTIWIVTNLLWDAYETSTPDSNTPA